MPAIVYTDEQKRTIAKLFASKFIARQDVKAFQKPDGSYAPRRSRFTMTDLVDHINGTATYGHYLLRPEGNEFLTKMIVFDVDINKITPLPTGFDGERYLDYEDALARDVWRGVGEKTPVSVMQQKFLSMQLRVMGDILLHSINDYLKVPAAIAYTGSKGIHVYAFTGLVPADLARNGIKVVTDGLQMESKRGNNFFQFRQHPSGDPMQDFSQLEIEVFPKQDTLAEDGGLGNLVRLPLGINHHNPKHPTFFMDVRGSMLNKPIVPRSAIESLMIDSPWDDYTPEAAV